MQHVVKHFEMRGERAFEEHCQRAVTFASKRKKKKGQITLLKLLFQGLLAKG